MIAAQPTTNCSKRRSNVCEEPRQDFWWQAPGTDGNHGTGAGRHQSRRAVNQQRQCSHVVGDHGGDATFGGRTPSKRVTLTAGLDFVSAYMFRGSSRKTTA